MQVSLIKNYAHQEFLLLRLSEFAAAERVFCKRGARSLIRNTRLSGGLEAKLAAVQIKRLSITHFRLVRSLAWSLAAPATSKSRFNTRSGFKTIASRSCSGRSNESCGMSGIAGNRCLVSYLKLGF